MEIGTQLAIFLENRPGTLAKVCDVLSAARINIFAVTTSDTVDQVVIRMVVDDPRRAMLIFEERGTLVVDDEVLLVEGGNQPGSLADITKRLARGRVNVEYLYSATHPRVKKGLLVLRVDNVKKALRVLNT
jgi:hypothetical protein